MGSLVGVQNGEPSRTALVVAQARARHQTVDEPRVFCDPLAEQIVSGCDDSSSEFDKGLDEDLIRVRRLTLAARSRFAEDVVAEAIGRKVRQVVVLGAGLDTAAYRNTRGDVRFYEVDHPATQEWKRRRLAETGIVIPPTVTFAPVDFETSTLAAGLAHAGLDRTKGAVFVWLGVAMYLNRPAVEQTLRYIAGQGESADVVFDYHASLPERVTAAETRQFEARAAALAKVGEPIRGLYPPDDIAEIVRSAGFTHLDDDLAQTRLASYGVQVEHVFTTSCHIAHAARRE